MEKEITEATELREKQKAVALELMRTLNIMPKVIKDFEHDGIVYYSFPTPLGGILYWMTNNPEWNDVVKEFENEYGALVYHATEDFTDFGHCLSLLFVSKYEEDRETTLELAREKYPDGTRYVYAYVMNLDYPEYSEFGSIGVKEKAGGLIRVA